MTTEIKPMDKAIQAIWVGAVAGFLFLIFMLPTSSTVLGSSQTGEASSIDGHSDHDEDGHSDHDEDGHSDHDEDGHSDHDHGHEESIQDNLDDIDLSNQRVSEWGRVIATLDHGSNPVSSNKPHDLIVELKDKAGSSAEVSGITVYADLLTHEDGLSGSPGSIKDLGGGRILIEGLVLPTPGLWQLTVVLEVANLKDVVVFNFEAS
jgi:hypothetical protein